SRLAKPVFARSNGRGQWHRLAAGLSVALAIGALAVIPARVAHFAMRDALRWKDMLNWPWADEPELVQFLTDRLSLRIGGPFRGSVNFLVGNSDGTIDDLWIRGVPTVNEYSQTASAPSLYFLHKMVKRDVRGLLNVFEFFWREGSYSPRFWEVSQLL